MRIPTGISLASYIRKLIEENKIEEFYQTDDWKELRAEVLEELHNECQECLKNGELTTEELCVHHVNEVKDRPDLALSKFYIDSDGNKQRQLIPLCKICHNKVHKKLEKWHQKDKFTNEELW